MASGGTREEHGEFGEGGLGVVNRQQGRPLAGAGVMGLTTATWLPRREIAGALAPAARPADPSLDL